MFLKVPRGLGKFQKEAHPHVWMNKDHGALRFPIGEEFTARRRGGYKEGICLRCMIVPGIPALFTSLWPLLVMTQAHGGD